ncbi:MAG TPA: mucoidy inhibitor MuiA family protein [Candidatus Obscuribacterales bacterium]
MPDSTSASALTPVETAIAAVTVYPDQARITRRGHIEVTPGVLLLEVGPLPAVLQASSLQAYAHGSAHIILQKPRLELLAPQPLADRGVTLNGQTFHQIEDAFRQCKDELAGLSHQQTFLITLAERTARTFAQGLSQQTTQLEAVAQFMAYFEQAYHTVAAAIATQERRKHELDQKLQQARQLMQQAQANAAQPQYRILLPMQVVQGGHLEINLVYDVTQAQWRPAYDVRVQSDRPALQLDCIAEIQQNTGELWPAVALTVSTAVPEKTPAIPEPSGLRLPPPREPDRAPPRKGDLKSRSRMLDETYRMLGALPGSEIPPPLEDTALGNGMVQPISAVVRLAAIAPATVPSDGQPQRVAVGQIQLDGQLTYIALPQRCSAPYLRAKLTNPADKWPLLPGTADLFRGGGYIGEETFNYVAPGESFYLSLGLDDRVTVQRELVAEQHKGEGHCRDLRSFRLTLHNPLPHPIEVTVVEQIPTSRTADVTVTLAQATPPTTVDAAGQCQWSLQLAASETQHICYQYAIEHPADMPLSALDT